MDQHPVVRDKEKPRALTRGLFFLCIITGIQKFSQQEVIHSFIMQSNNTFIKRNNMTLIDTCSLLEVPASELYLKTLRASSGKVIVLWAVVDELRRKIRDRDPDISSRAQKIFNLIFEYEARGLVTLGLGDDKNSRNFADNIFLGIVFKYGLRNDITIITQDRKLADDLLSAKHSRSVNGLNISVKRLESDGTLADFVTDSASQNTHQADQFTERSTNSMNVNALRIPPLQLLQQFRNNRETGARVYKNQCIMFTGKIVRTHKEGRSFITELMADAEGFRGRIICRFNESFDRELGQLERGQTVSISGMLSNVDTYFGDIEISDCRLHDSSYGERKNLPLRVTFVSEEKITRTQIPEVGSKVFGRDKREYFLTGLISRGRKSTVYEAVSADGSGKKLAAKIYTPEFCTVRQLEKLRLIVGLGLKFNGICFPEEILLNGRGEFSGFLMARAEGDKLEDLFCMQSEFESRYPGWKKTDMVQLTLNILDRIKYIHDNGIIIGNLVPENIMLATTEEMYFIDADSWQYKEFPCPDGDVYATAPELQGKDFSKTLRTMGNENFAVASLVFRLMMQGYPPYASFERELPEEEIRAGKFPYTVGEFNPVKGYKAPAMEARRIWSHLVRQLKDSFIETFNENGKYFREEARPSVDQWIKDVEYYSSCLPKMINSDAASDDIFPKDTRKALDKRYGS